MEVIRCQVEMNRVNSEERRIIQTRNGNHSFDLTTLFLLTYSLSIRRCSYYSLTHTRTQTRPIAPSLCIPIYPFTYPHHPPPPPSALHALIYLFTPHLTLFPIGVPVVHHPFTRQSSDAITAAFDAALNTICASSSTTRHH